MDIRRQSVKIYHQYGKGGTYKVVTRMVHDATLTGHIAQSWTGDKYYQWEGWVWFMGEKVEVWGYTLDPVFTPVKWANDTY